MAAPEGQTATDRHRIVRVRRETRRRTATVVRVEPLGSCLLRVHLASPDLHDFESAGADDHVKLFVPDGAGGEARRDYTPRLFDPAAGSLTIDFALHGAQDVIGPATRWAMAARPGDVLSIGGPRGSAVVPDDFDWYLLVGDETAVPSISRRMEELRAGVPVFVVLLADGPGSRPPLPERDRTTVRWCDRDADAAEGDLLRAAIDGLDLPSGDGFVWIGAEAAAARMVRAHVADVLAHPAAWTKASGYWLAGTAGEHVKLG